MYYTREFRVTFKDIDKLSLNYFSTDAILITNTNRNQFSIPDYG
jgi:hypothetical protein